MKYGSFSFLTRGEFLEGINGREVDFTVIGGGITGAGIANILAQNGLEPVLLESSDFASGTSSGSSKLIHGGLRYLAQGHLLLTRHLLKERNYLQKHVDFVQKLDFDILIDRYSWSSGKIRFGLFLYSILGGGFRIPKFKRNEGEYPPDVKGYFRYHDAYAVDSVLVMYNIVSSVNHGARCINYAAATSIVREGEFYRIEVRDMLSDHTYSFKSRYIINCAGPWVKTVADMLKVESEGIFRLSKGVHLIFRKSDVPVNRAIAFKSHIDGRQMFFIPAGKVTIVGTTDTFTDRPDDFSVNEEDIDYIIRSSERLFTGVSRKNITASYAGIRPLFGTGDTPGDISRDFFILRSYNTISVFGGKLTDYRNVARKVATLVSKMSGKSMKIRGLPAIDYKRPARLKNPEYFIEEECALTPEDVYRRRTADSLYMPDFEKRRDIVTERFNQAFDKFRNRSNSGMIGEASGKRNSKD